MSVTSESRSRTNGDVPEMSARVALAKVVSSEIFTRSPQQTKLLSYLCVHFFDGTSDGLKEYTIATEVMGLKDNYDQTEGSTVRVAIHRLRKRLKAYYETEGKDDTIEIRLNAGGYAPEFHFRSEGGQHLAGPSQPELPSEPVSPIAEAAAAPWVDESSVHEPNQPGPQKVEGRSGRPYWIGGAILVLILAAFYPLYQRVYNPKATTVVPQAQAPARDFESTPGVPEGAAIRILAGSKTDEYTDPNGNIWSGDRFYEGGEARVLGDSEKAARSITIKRVGDQNLVRHFRSGQNFSYAIPVPAGTYELLLGFVETIYGPEKAAGGGENRRTFTVKINGEVAIDHLDIFSDANGADTLDAKRFSNLRPMADGKIHLAFNTASDNPAVLNFLELLPEANGHPNPIRISTRTRSFIDNLGRSWAADTYYLGGQLASHVNHTANTSVPELYENERYGNFSYEIPVARNRTYRVALYFSEDYFGTPDHSDENQGARIFDVTCNETTLLRDFDILKEAGGRDRAIFKVFSGLKASPQGRLSIAFVPSRNYAVIDAIEITEDTK